MRTIKLRYAGRCADCGAALAVRTEACWDSADRTVRCVVCPPPVVAGGIPDAEKDVPVPADWPSPAALPVAATPDAHGDVAGGSAQAEYERRHRRREERLEAAWGPFAGIAKFLSDDPQSTKAWAQGADGERRLARTLERALDGRAVFLHDRKHGRANIDHLIIASSGVWVIDAKKYAGRVEYRNVAGWLRRPDYRIYVGGRDKTKLATGLDWQVDAVRVALGEFDVPIHAALCFTSSDWAWFAKPLRHDGVVVTWAAKLVEMIAKPGPLDPEDIEHAAQRLRERLKPATR